MMRCNGLVHILGTLLWLAIAAPTAHAQLPPPIDPDPPAPITTDALSDKVLTLAEARQVLRAQSYDLKISERSIESASLYEEQAISIWIPNVSLSGNYTMRDREVALQFPSLPGQPPAPPTVVQFRHNYSITGTVSQTLFNARAFPGLRLADLAIAQAQNAKEQTDLQLQGTLQQLYFNTVRFKRFIDVSRRNVELARLTYQRANDSFEAGVGNRFEVNRAKVELSSAQREFDRAELSYNLSVDSLASFLNIEPDFDIETPPQLDVPDRYESFIEKALQDRADLVGQRIQLSVDEERIRENESLFWPTLSTSVQGTYQRANAFAGDPLFWTISLNANWTIYDGGVRNIETRSREIAAAQSALRIQQQRAKVSGEVRQQWLRIQTEQSNIAAARDEASLSSENFELTREAQRLGTATALEVEVAQRQVYLSELALVTAEIQLQSELYELYRIAGELRE